MDFGDINISFSYGNINGHWERNTFREVEVWKTKKCSIAQWELGSFCETCLYVSTYLHSHYSNMLTWSKSVDNIQLNIASRLWNGQASGEFIMSSRGVVCEHLHTDMCTFIINQLCFLSFILQTGHCIGFLLNYVIGGLYYLWISFQNCEDGIINQLLQKDAGPNSVDPPWSNQTWRCPIRNS